MLIEMRNLATKYRSCGQDGGSRAQKRLTARPDGFGGKDGSRCQHTSQRGTQLYYSFILRDSQALGIRGQCAPATHEEPIVLVQTPVGASGQRQSHFLVPWCKEDGARVMLPAVPHSHSRGLEVMEPAARTNEECNSVEQSVAGRSHPDRLLLACSTPNGGYRSQP